MSNRHDDDEEEEFSALNRESSYDPDAEHDDGFGGGGGGGGGRSGSYRDDPHSEAEFGVSSRRRQNGSIGAKPGEGTGGRSTCSTLLSAAILLLVGTMMGMALDRYRHPGDGAGGGGVVILPHGAGSPPGGDASHAAVEAVDDDGSKGNGKDGGQQPQPPKQEDMDDEDEDVADDDSPSYDEEEGDLTVGQNMSLANPLPPLSSLVKGTQITEDVSWLLDFAVVDFPKCGTTFLMNYLSKNDEAYLNHGEVCSMDRHRPYKIVNRYYPIQKAKRYTDDGRRIKYGLKCPEELETEFALGDYVRYFPDIKFVITVRHPVSWFQSYYNFRAYNSYPQELPPTDQLIGPCQRGYPYVPWNCSHHCPSGNMKVCTHRAKFHHSLSRLGKTPMTSPDERALLEDHGMTVLPTTNRVFLMENRQIVLENPSSATFPDDLRDFLELDSDLDPLRHFEKKAGRYSEGEAAKRKIDICDSEHDKVRAVLVEHGRDAARWIAEYFMKSSDVVVSSPERFVELLDDWGTDPCDDREKFRI